MLARYFAAGISLFSDVALSGAQTFYSYACAGDIAGAVALVGFVVPDVGVLGGNDASYRS